MSKDEIAGVRVVCEACRQPLRVIVENTGKSADVVMNELRSNISDQQKEIQDLEYISQQLAKSTEDSETKKSNLEAIKGRVAEIKKNGVRVGYDASRHVYCDLIDNGVIDPHKVEYYALLHACSVIGLVLTTNAVVVVESAG